MTAAQYRNALAQLGQAVDIHEMRRPRQSQIQQWHQTLPAREHFRVRPQIRQQRKRLSQRPRRVIG